MTAAHTTTSGDDELAAMFPPPPPSPVSEETYYRWSESHVYLRAEWIDGEISYIPPQGPIHEPDGPGADEHLDAVPGAAQTSARPRRAVRACGSRARHHRATRV